MGSCYSETKTKKQRPFEVTFEVTFDDIIKDNIDAIKIKMRQFPGNINYAVVDFPQDNEYYDVSHNMNLLCGAIAYKAAEITRFLLSLQEVDPFLLTPFKYINFTYYRKFHIKTNLIEELNFPIMLTKEFQSIDANTLTERLLYSLCDALDKELEQSNIPELKTLGTNLVFQQNLDLNILIESIRGYKPNKRWLYVLQPIFESNKVANLKMSSVDVNLLGDSSIYQLLNILVKHIDWKVEREDFQELYDKIGLNIKDIHRKEILSSVIEGAETRNYLFDHLNCAFYK